jgi:hypothetical protein
MVRLSGARMPQDRNEHLFVSKSRVSANTVQGVCLQLDGCRVPGAPPSFPAAGHYRLAGGRLEDALRAPLRGRAAPGP